ncbi:MAG: sugar phosphate isomerase/epimerase family protein [Roseiflexaceae bacterium]
MQIGTLQNVLNEPLGSSFVQAARLGFDCIELDWNAPADALPGGVMSPTMRAMMQQTARTNGVTIQSVAAHFLNNGGIASTDSTVVAAGMLNIRRGIELCASIGATVLLVPFFFHGEIVGEDGIARLTDNLARLASDAASANVKLGIENTLTATQNAAIVDAVKSPFVGVYWDMANGIACGYDAVADVRTLGKRLVQVHAKEFKHDGGMRGTRANPRFDLLNAKPLGQGDVPVPGVIAALKAVGYTGAIVLETGSFGNHHASAQAAGQYLRSLL